MRMRPACGLAVALLAAGLLIACPRQAPPVVATRAASIPEVNTPDSFMDTVALAPDGRRVATGERGGVIRVWAVDGPREGIRVGAHRQSVTGLAFSPDGALLATIGRARESMLRLWHDDGMGGWTETAAIPAERCLALRFDAVGTRLGVACETNVMILDVATRRLAARLPNPHAEPLTAFDLAADGGRAITAGRDGGVTVWDVTTAAPVGQFSVRSSRRKHGPPGGMAADTAWGTAVTLTPDGRRAAAATIEGSIFVWDLETGQELLADVDNDATGPPHGALRFTADGRLLAPTGNRAGMRLIDVAHKRSQVVAMAGTSGTKAFHAVSVTDDATRYAVLTSVLGDRQLAYTVDVWRVAPSAPPR